MARARSRSAFQLIGAGLACMVHAVVPGWFTETAGRTWSTYTYHIHPEEQGGIVEAGELVRL